MSKDIVFSHSTAKGCWVSEEIAQASMAYIQVTRKEPGFLRVYTYAEGQRPVLVHVTQQANAVVFADYQPADVRLLVESETEVVSAVVCQDSTGASGGDTYTKTEADSRFQLKGDYATNSSVDTKLADYATTASVNTELDKKADKAKAFTTDTVSTAPGQFVAGPINTKGNIGLRKIDVRDIPNLSDTYPTNTTVNTWLANKVNIKGVSVAHPQDTALPKVVKIVTISVPNIRYQTGYLGGVLMCRDTFIKFLISINNNSIPSVVKVVKESSPFPSAESLYYYQDVTNSKVVLYYIMNPYDTVTSKITDKDNNMIFTWNLDMSIVDALPEGAIKVNDVNYGNKNLFYATPKNAAGNPEFRTIDITDLPDLSSKYGTKAEISTINDNITDLHSSLESTQTDFVDLRNKVNAMPKTVFITQAAYNALTTKDANTIYYING